MLFEESKTIHFSLPHVYVHTLFSPNRFPVSSQILTGFIRVRICFGWIGSKSCQLGYTAVSLSHFVSQWLLQSCLLKLALVSSVLAGGGLAVKVRMASVLKTHMSRAVTLPLTQMSPRITCITFICTVYFMKPIYSTSCTILYKLTQKNNIWMFYTLALKSVGC